MTTSPGLSGLRLAPVHAAPVSGGLWPECEGGYRLETSPSDGFSLTETLESLRVALADRYTLGRRLGRGGMGTVYLAEDLRHGRAVAIKVLHPQIAVTLGVERFLREIRIEAGLTHPHILPLHDSGEAAGLLYYVMPYMEGESLRERLLREGRVPLADALRIGSEIADALDHAHSHGLVHRDVKPGNILLSGTHSYLCDFGVARALYLAGDTRITETGMALGTAAYMSPEQGSGTVDVDARSDIYSLGCVLYEMLAGAPPFTGPTGRVAFLKRMTEQPVPLHQMRPDVPGSVETVVKRALQLDPEDRFQTAAELRDALVAAGNSPSAVTGTARWERVRSGARAHPARAVIAAVGAAALLLGGLGVADRVLSPKPEVTRAGVVASSTVSGAGSTVRTTPDVAVLLLDDLSPEGEHRALAMGITAELIRRLGEGGLRVPSLQAVKPLEQRELSLDSLHSILGADLLVQGSVMPLGPRLRVALDLLDAKTGLQLESARREAPAESVTVLLDGVTQDLARFLRKQLGREFRVRELQTGTRSDSAWLLTWRAEELREQRQSMVALGDTAAANALLRQADSLLIAAEAKDRHWADPIVQRGWVAYDRGLLAATSPGVATDQWARTAIQHADKALAVEKRNAAALELRGTAEFDLAQQVEGPEQAGYFKRARADLEDAVGLEPARPGAWKTLSELLYEFPGEFRASYDAALRAQQEDRFLREDRGVVFRLAQASLDLQQYQEALTRAEDGRRLWPDAVEFPAVELAVLASSPQTANVRWAWALADTILQFTAPKRRDLFRPIFLAQVAAVLGHAGLRDSATAVLREAVEATKGKDEAVREYAAYDIAHAWLVVGDREQSLEWLALDLHYRPYKRAYHSRDLWFAPLRDDPRFRELVQPEGEGP